MSLEADPPAHPATAGTGPLTSPWKRETLAVVLEATSVLFANGETTERTIDAGQRIAGAHGCRSAAVARWDGLTIRLEDGEGACHDIVPVTPIGIDMRKVTEAERAVDALCTGALRPQETVAVFRRTAALAPVSVVRSTLAIVFGAEHVVSVGLIAVSAGLGALVRRGLAGVSRNPFVQPLAAASLAGLVGGLAQRYQLSSPLALVALCPCMVLVPGPHFLNGLADVIHARVALGAARLAFALLVVAAISTGLLVGLWGTGATLPVSPPSRAIALPVDVAAAGLAVFAYSSFYSMPWRQLRLPILTGMAAHALRWSALALGASAYAAAFFVCLLAGLVTTLLGARLRLPFAALSFAAVVALIPGVFLFRLAAAFVQIAGLGEKAPPALVSITLGDGVTATLILMAMGLGLLAPRLLAERFGRATVPATNGGSSAHGHGVSV